MDIVVSLKAADKSNGGYCMRLKVGTVDADIVLASRPVETIKRDKPASLVFV